MTVWQPAYVGVGSNLREPRGQVEQALARLAELPLTRLVSRSSCHATKPVGPVAQPDFVNAVAGLLTQLAAGDLLRELHALERALGREPAPERWGPRVIDLDLLVYGRERRDDPGLTLPHPGIAERAFVLVPLAEIAPDLEIPGLGRVAALLAHVDTAGVQRLDR